MFAVQFDRFGGPEVLHLGTTDAPEPRSGQIRIRVQAAGVSPSTSACAPAAPR
ncbi:hypothetical protein NKG94_08590 [Micromonospora sp. M12]